MSCKIADSYCRSYARLIIYSHGTARLTTAGEGKFRYFNFLGAVFRLCGWISDLIVVIDCSELLEIAAPPADLHHGAAFRRGAV
jgi:hypothetical protein